MSNNKIPLNGVRDGKVVSRLALDIERIKYLFNYGR